MSRTKKTALEKMVSWDNNYPARNVSQETDLTQWRQPAPRFVRTINTPLQRPVYAKRDSVIKPMSSYYAYPTTAGSYYSPLGRSESMNCFYPESDYNNNSNNYTTQSADEIPSTSKQFDASEKITENLGNYGDLYEERYYKFVEKLEDSKNTEESEMEQIPANPIISPISGELMDSKKGKGKGKKTKK